MLRFNEIAERVQAYNPKADVLTLQKAYIFSAKVHSGQQRVSGEPYLTHPLEVAGILAQMKLDVPAIATGMLHDTVEDTLTTISEIETNFGPEIKELVDGVTKISKIHFQSKEDRQAENFRKMLLATTKDMRVILVKLADRLHNMRTIESLPEDKRRRIAEETITIYAPIANRLGLQWIKTELEDLSLKVLHPEAWKEIEGQVAEKQKEREKFVTQICDLIRAKLSAQGVRATVYGRAKHNYSIYKKMHEKNLPFEEIYDVIAFRIIVANVRECYESLGVVHSLWKPLPGKVKDYIALPKANMYQSLHTSVIGPDGRPMELQIRTHEMHEVAEYGVAAHWKYKEGKLETSAPEASYSWLRQMLADRSEVRESGEYMESLKVDLFPDEVYVFTPKGDVKVLPKGATPIDFAYSVHTEVGNTCTGAKVNGKIVPISHELKNGDIVSVTARAGQLPSRDWLKWVRTARARQKIREVIRSKEREQSLTLGREILEKELKRYGHDLEKFLKKGALAKVAERLGQKDTDKLLIAVSFGTVGAQHVIEELLPPEERKEAAAKPSGPASGFLQLIRGAPKAKVATGIQVKGGDGDVLVRFARCCSPLPGDKIQGFITRGRGISVHRADCIHVHEMIPERRIAVEWDKDSKAQRPVTVEILCADRPGLLASLSKAITAEDVNISRAEVYTTPDEKAVATFEVAVKDADHLKRILKALSRIKGVYNVHRVDASGAQAS